MDHIRTFTDSRLAELVRSHGRGGDGEIDVRFLAAVSAELVRRGTNYIPTKAGR